MVATSTEVDHKSVNFSCIPILDYSLLISPTTKPLFISELRDALVNVGFLYLSNHPIPSATVDSLITYIPNFFDLPQKEKEKCNMIHSPHFLGYSNFGAELTKGKIDHREQFDFGTIHETRWEPGNLDSPEYWRMWGPSQWPEESVLPGFRENVERYLNDVSTFSDTFISLVAEAFGLPSSAFDRFFDKVESMQHRGKIVKYPVTTDFDESNQGVGPHYDAGFLTFLLQASAHKGLQVQNLSGEWIDVPPIPETFVINIGKALEFVTQGLARATSHRVLSPRETPGEPSTPRYSIPFFQSIALDVRLADNILQIPQEILLLKERRGEISKTESVNFEEFDREPVGMVRLIGRVKSHPDIAERWYPELFTKYFPDGLVV